MSLFECCHTCQRRHVGCHGDCSDYNAAKKKNNAKKREEQRGYIEYVGRMQANMQRLAKTK